MTKRVALAFLGMVMLTACREKADRPATPPPSPPLVATPADTAPATAASSPPSPFPAPPLSALWPGDQQAGRLDTLLGHGAGSSPTCRQELPLITPDSIGPFRLGESLSDLQRQCPHLLYGWEWISDGYAVPAVAARLGRATITALLSDTLPTATLHTVELVAPGPRTAERVGVGSTLEELERAYGAPAASESDCILRVWFDSRPGLAFRMEYPPTAQRECGALSEEPLPPALRVVSVILVER